MRAGALGAFISGAGPTVLALSLSGDQALDRVQEAFESAARDQNVPGAVLQLALSERGAHVVA
jgi:homoserine kinase